MSSAVFTPEFFKKHAGGISAEEIDFWVRVCNQHVVENATVVYNNGNSPKYNWSPTFIHDDTHKALLIEIQPIVKEPCKHLKIQSQLSNLDEGQCMNCGVAVEKGWVTKS